MASSNANSYRQNDKKQSKSRSITFVSKVNSADYSTTRKLQHHYFTLPSFSTPQRSETENAQQYQYHTNSLKSVPMLLSCTLFLLSIAAYHLFFQHTQFVLKHWTYRTSTQPNPNSKYYNMSSCQNTIIFSGARQGSTWFVNSIENCKYSAAPSSDDNHIQQPSDSFSSKTYDSDVFGKTELWKHFGEPHIDGTNISAADALEYILHNSSIKIFPSVFWRRKQDIQHMLLNRHEYSVSVIILRRDVKDVWKSWLKAQSTRLWRSSDSSPSVIGTNNGEGEEDDNTKAPERETVELKMQKLEAEEDEYLKELHKQVFKKHPSDKFSKEYNYNTHFEYFVQSRQRYDRAVENLLRKHKITYDAFEFEAIRGKAVIVAENNFCWISNCNFDKATQLKALQDLGIRTDNLLI